MPINRSLSSPLVLALLLVPVILGACKGRAVLEQDRVPGKKHVEGAVVKPATNIASNDSANSPPAAVGSSADSVAEAVADSSSTAASPRTPAHVTLWYARHEGEQTRYTAYMRGLPKAPANKIEALNIALGELVVGPDKRFEHDFTSEIPKGTRLLSVTQVPGSNSGDLVVNLSREFIDSGGMDSFGARMEQLRRTVVGIVGDQPVYLDVEGKRLETSGDGLEVQQPINKNAVLQGAPLPGKSLPN